jgi:hypothetical protein
MGLGRIQVDPATGQRPGRRIQADQLADAKPAAIEQFGDAAVARLQAGSSSWTA